MMAGITLPRPATNHDGGLEELSALGFGEVINRLNVMRKQEDTRNVCSDYLKITTSCTTINETCRKKMVMWCFQVVDFNKITRDTVVIAMSYLDAFLSSGAQRAIDVVKSRRDFQLASMTTLYIAIKLFEPVEMSTAALATLSRNTYTAEDFAQMELDILSALNWRLHQPTVLSFLEHFVALIPPRSVWNNVGRELLIYICKRYTDLTLSDYYFVTQKPSTVAITIILTSLEHMSFEFLTETDRCSFFNNISNALKIESSTQDIFLARRRLASISHEFVNIKSKSVPMVSYKVGNNSISSLPNASRSLSPICVSVKEKNTKVYTNLFQTR